MARCQILEQACANYDLTDVLRIACETSLSRNLFAGLLPYVESLGSEFMGPEWSPAFVHALAELIREAVHNPETIWQRETLPEWAQDLREQDQSILDKLFESSSS